MAETNKPVAHPIGISPLRTFTEEGTHRVGWYITVNALIDSAPLPENIPDGCLTKESAPFIYPIKEGLESRIIGKTENGIVKIEYSIVQEPQKRTGLFKKRQKIVDSYGLISDFYLDVLQQVKIREQKVINEYKKAVNQEISL